jgi:hypothetical protein
MTVTEYGQWLPARAYNSVWQLRGDAWSSLADATKRLFESSLHADQNDTLRKEVASLFQLLDPIETGPTPAANSCTSFAICAKTVTTKQRCG